MRILKYSEALNEATLQAMEQDPRVFLIGEGIDDPKGTFGTTLGAFKKYGSKRVLDSPLSENALTGIGIGAAVTGHPCVMIHMRSEFLLYAMDQIVNHAAKWRYMNGGRVSVPITIRCIVGRGWGQAAQHSQSFQAFYAHVPGLKVILPSTASEAKGLLYSAILDPDPVICIEHRWLFDRSEAVQEEPYKIPIGKACVRAPGKDVTCIALSYQVLEALNAREELLKEGIEMEVIDLRSPRPLDVETILSSVRKTGRVIVTDIAHVFGGVSAEISATITERAFHSLKGPILRVGLPDAPTPCSWVLEEKFYPKVQDLVKAARSLTRSPSKTPETRHPVSFQPSEFQGPF